MNSGKRAIFAGLIAGILFAVCLFSALHSGLITTGWVVVMIVFALDWLMTIRLSRKRYAQGYDKGWLDAKAFYVPAGTKPQARTWGVLHGDDCNCETCRDERAGSGNC